MSNSSGDTFRLCNHHVPKHFHPIFLAFTDDSWINYYDDGCKMMIWKNPIILFTFISWQFYSLKKTFSVSHTICLLVSVWACAFFFYTMCYITQYSHFPFGSSNFHFGQTVFCVILTLFPHFLSPFLLSGVTRCSRLILRFPCLIPEMRHFSKKP